MNRKWIAAALIPAMLGVSACDDEQVGTIAGAAAGAAAGRAIGGSGTGGYIGLVLGALAGGYLGGKIANWMTEKDHAKLGQTTNAALESGQNGETYRWANEESGNRGTVTPTQTTTTADGQTCRTFTQTATSAAGENASDTGRACKQADGTWKIVA